MGGRSQESGGAKRAKSDKRAAAGSLSGGDQTLNREEIFAAIPILSNIDNELLKQLEPSFMIREFAEGERLIERDGEGTDVFFLISGIVRVLNYSNSGRTVSYATLGPGDYFGELAAIDEKPRSATVVSGTDCRVLVLPRGAFVRLATTDPAFALSLMQRMADVIRFSDDRISELTSLGAQQRLCLELLRLAGQGAQIEGQWEVYPVPTQETFAATIGATRETVARVFSRLTQDGIIERKARVLHIRDRKRLEEMTLQDAL